MQPRLRLAIGPLLAGIGIWCALGRVTLSDPDSAGVRLVAPAPIAWLPAAILMASAVPLWRRRPLTATPVLLSTMAWWPVPLPMVGLLWTGMFAWVPIPEKFRGLGSLEFSKLLIEKADVAVAPGIGFGEHGDGYVRIALVENEQRIRQAARNVRKFLETADKTLHNVVPISAAGGR